MSHQSLVISTFTSNAPLKTPRHAMRLRFLSVSVLFFLTNLSFAQIPLAESSTKLSKEALQQVMPGAQLRFTSLRGNNLSWTNDPAGTMTANSSSPSGRNSVAPGKWHISNDGRFCVRVDWGSSLEEWCRFVIKESDGYYLTQSNGKKVSRLDISGK